jgi:hypothetical protein
MPVPMTTATHISLHRVAATERDEEMKCPNKIENIIAIGISDSTPRCKALSLTGPQV